MTLVRSQFSPPKDGFRFVNRFEFKFPVKFDLPLVGQVDLNEVVYGLCGGMCFSALDYFHSGNPIPEVAQVDEIESKLFIYLCDRQLDSLKIPVILKVVQCMVSSERDFSLRMARYEIPKLRRLVDKGEPAVLALIRVKGLDDPTKNHQVLATGYDYDLERKQMTVTLYDPNHPGTEPTLTLNLEQPSKGIEISQSTGEYLRGFFLINYKPQSTLPILHTPFFSLSYAPGEFNLRWPVDSHRVNQYFGENPESYKPFGLPGHEGLDLYAPNSANVYAAADGEVYQVNHPKGHPYGLQVRIRHEWGSEIYHSIYAHLSKTFVKKTQIVSAGERIGLADNTGNSFGSHLHLTLKLEGANTPGYPAGIIDPWPLLESSAESPSPPPAPDIPEETLPAPSGLTVYTMAGLNLRAQPSTGATIRGTLPAGEALSVLGDIDQARSKISKEGEWLQVQTASGLPGYVAAWFVHTMEQALPPSELIVYPNDLLNMRSGPGIIYDLLATKEVTDPLTVLGDAGNARSKIGKQDEWLQVQTQDGVRGFVAAWLVHTTGQPIPASDLIVYPLVVLNVRARPIIGANLLTVVTPNDPLRVLGDGLSARERIGIKDQWLEVLTPLGHRGFVAAWLVQLSSTKPSTDQTLVRLDVFPTVDLNIRAQASINSPRVGGAFHGEALQVIDADLEAARALIGKEDEWIHVETKDGSRGWAAAWFLSTEQV